MLLRLLTTAGGLFFAFTIAFAHELRPAYLEITEAGDNKFAVLWKVPRSSSSNLLLDLNLVLPASCGDSAPPVRKEVSSGLITRRVVNCGSAGLLDQEISVGGLAAANSKVLTRLALAGLETQSIILSPDEPAYVIESEPSKLRVARDYTVLGIEHILLGIDHLLFVLALLLNTHGLVALIKAITSFTVAHSITLTLATLGFVGLPGPPVEAMIALSILFLARELARRQKGRAGLTQSSPWIVAFSFGLLHGFGFAGALSEVGLPQAEIPLALFTFNVGVELGQLIFVAGVLVFMWILQRMRVEWPFWLRQAPAYMIGTMAMFWCAERISGFW
jgi:hydrogenase/urease accessory protein HupE